MQEKKRAIEINDDKGWNDILHWLPHNYEEKMREMKAFVRARKIKSPSDLLRIMLAYPVLQFSLEDLSRWALEKGIADITSISIWERSQAMLPFLRWLVTELLSSSVKPTDSQLNLAPIDGTTFTLPASNKRDWILHLIWMNGKPIDLRLTKAKGKGSGESMKHLYNVRENAVILGDRAYGTPNGVEHAIENGFNFISRFVWNNLPLYESEDSKTRIEPSKILNNMPAGDIKDFQCWMRGKNTKAKKVRIVIIRKDKYSAEKAIRQSKKDSTRKGHKPQKVTLFMAQFVALVTNLTEEQTDKNTIIDAYRWRWQIEREFRRFKSSTYIRKLVNHKDSTVEVYILASLVAWLLSCKIAETALFFPWGYPLPRSGKKWIDKY